MALSNRLKEWKEFRCEAGVLTLYLNTFTGRNGEWKIRLKNGLKRLEQYVEARGQSEEQRNYKKVKQKVLKEVKRQQMNLQKSVVIFASVDAQLWEIHHLQLEVENEFCWEDRPVVQQLQAIQERYPSSGILVLQQKDVLAIDTSLGEIEEETYFSLDIEKENWRMYEGRSATERTASRSNHKDRYDARIEANLQRWFKDLAPKIEHLAKQKKWKELHIVGQKELIQEIQKHLKMKTIKIIPKNLYSQPTHSIVGEVFA